MRVPPPQKPSDLIRQRIQDEFAVEPSDREFLLLFLRGNLKEIRRAIGVCRTPPNWEELTHWGGLLAAAGTNLDLDDLRQCGLAVSECAKKQDADMLVRVCGRLDAVLAACFGLAAPTE